MIAYYLYNAHGDVVQLADTSGMVTKAYHYDAFGNEKDLDETDTNPTLGTPIDYSVRQWSASLKATGQVSKLELYLLKILYKDILS